MTIPLLVRTPPSEKCFNITITILSKGIKSHKNFKLRFSFSEFLIEYMQKGGENRRRQTLKKLYGRPMVVPSRKANGVTPKDASTTPNPETLNPSEPPNQAAADPTQGAEGFSSINIGSNYCTKGMKRPSTSLPIPSSLMGYTNPTIPPLFPANQLKKMKQNIPEMFKITKLSQHKRSVLPNYFLKEMDNIQQLNRTIASPVHQTIPDFPGSEEGIGGDVWGRWNISSFHILSISFSTNSFSWICWQHG